MDFGFLDISSAGQDSTQCEVCEVVMSIDIVRIGGDRFLEMEEGLREIARASRQVAQVALRFGQIGFNTDGLALTSLRRAWFPEPMM
jgi:hypothetical protein